MKPAAELAAANGKPYPNDSADYRRALAPGGIAPAYQFRDENGATVGLADLLGRHDTLCTYFWMYAPQRERQLAFARERGWRNLKFYAAVGGDFPRDVHGLAPDGNHWPALDIWTNKDGVVRHFWGGELGGTEDPGQDARGAPDPTPLWNILDLTPAGRGTDWYPMLEY